MLQQIGKKYKWIGILSLFVVLTTFNSTSSNFINIFFPIKVIEYNKTFFLMESCLFSMSYCQGCLNIPYSLLVVVS